MYGIENKLFSMLFLSHRQSLTTLYRDNARIKVHTDPRQAQSFLLAHSSEQIDYTLSQTCSCA